jgi:hypothetical protein
MTIETFVHSSSPSAGSGCTRVDPVTVHSRPRFKACVGEESSRVSSRGHVTDVEIGAFLVGFTGISHVEMSGTSGSNPPSSSS